MKELPGAEFRAHIKTWFKHIRVLVDHIGPRGSTTDAERRASEYCAETLQSLDYEVTVEPFRSATSLYLVHVIAGLMLLSAFIIYPLAGRIGAAAAFLLAFIAMYSETMEMLFRNNPIRSMLPRGNSQNVIARLDPSDEHLQDLILVGHVDTNRSPLMFRSTKWLDFFRTVTTITYSVFAAQVPIYLAGWITQGSSIRYLSIPSLLCAIVMVFIMLEAEMSPFSPGANDNATSVGLVLTLAEMLKNRPLKNTRVWFVNTGCEEVKHYGAIDFFKRYKSKFKNPKALVFEIFGIDGPAWLAEEGMIGYFNYKASPELVSICEDIAAASPELEAHPTTVNGGHSEMADALRLGIPAITFIGLNRHGARKGYSGPELFWHRIDDTVDKLRPRAMLRNFTFTWQFITRLDRDRQG
ncbi:MAG: M28 family peptidase [Anaerolineae bacterium]|nr:M28 family peptidase [Anaerolineae bacterium]